MSVPGAGSRSAFRYRAARPDGSVVRGELAGSSVEDVFERLARGGLVPIEVLPARVRALPRRSARASRQDLAAAFRAVSSLVRAGMGVERALAAAEGLVKDPLREALADARRRIREGEGVADALGAHAGAFPPVVVGIVAAGERGSRLAEALGAAAEQLEDEAELRSQVRSALAYPALILTVGVASLVVMGGVVVPRFAELVRDMGAELPATTRALLAASAALRRFGPPALAPGALLAAAALRSLRRPEARRGLHRALLRTPGVGPIRHGLASARVCRALGATLAAGMPLLSALEVAREAAGDEEVSARLAAAREAVARGERLAPSLEAAGALAPLALQLVDVGETSGELAPMVARAGELAGSRAKAALGSLVAVLEPALVIGLGAAVAFVAGALLQAVYSVRPGG